MATPLRVLIIEDSADDAELLVSELEHGGYEVTWNCVETEPALRETLSSDTWDLILSDYSMPQFDGLRAFAVVRELGVDTPFIFVSGALGEERAVEAMRAGARDYLLKGNLKRLCSAVQRELAEADNRRRRREAEEARRLSERRYQSIFESAGAALIELDLSDVRRFVDSLGDDPAGQLREDPELCAQAARHARILDANATALALLGAKERESVLGPLGDVIQPGSLVLWRDVVCAFARGASQLQVAGWLQPLDGKAMQVIVSARIPEEGMDFRNVVLGLLDVTERHELQEQLRASQRMESIGRLAGGIAHDFNNLLTVITSHGSFLREEVTTEEAREDLNVLMKAADKAGGLTRQLLAFSRRQVQRLEVLSIADVVRDLDRMLRRLIGEDVGLETIIDPDLGFVEVDPSHIEQVLMNLAVNARDAMPGGGKLTIEVANVVLDDAYTRGKRAEVPSGSYVMLAVSDTGTGMDEETISQVFEPFFTTKEAGKGTGLGLSTVYGIVTQSKGYVWVYSEPGRGTTFKVYLPRVEKTGRRRPASARPSHRAPRGHETILLVEDQVLVRRAAARILRARGYHVLEAESGDAALRAASAHEGPIHLMLTDIVMPGMPVRELVDRLQSIRGDLRVIYMSGYTDNAIVHQGVLEEGTEFLEKPFSPDALARQVRAVLDEGSSDP